MIFALNKMIIIVGLELEKGEWIKFNQMILNHNCK